MLIRSQDAGFVHPVPSDITPRAAYLGRREWLQRLALGAGGAALAGWASREALAQSAHSGVSLKSRHCAQWPIRSTAKASVSARRGSRKAPA